MEMKKIVLVWLAVMAVGCGVARAQPGRIIGKGFRPAISAAAVQAARLSFEHARLMRLASRSLVQISRPNSRAVLGTGFVFKAQGRPWVAMPYHIGGMAGAQRVIRFRGPGGKPVEKTVTIAVNGNSGWHAPDVSLAPLAAEDALFFRPLQVGRPELLRPAYSFGFLAGREMDLNDFLPVKRHIFTSEGFGLVADRIIFGEDEREPFQISGYCGAPVMQLINGVWRAVGIHTGSCTGTSGLPRSYAANLSKVLPLLLEGPFRPSVLSSRRLVFRGWDLGALLPSEKVVSVEVFRNGKSVFFQKLRNYPEPYSDGRSELALGDFEILKGDTLKYEICNNQHDRRFISYKLP